MLLIFNWIASSAQTSTLTKDSLICWTKDKVRKIAEKSMDYKRLKVQTEEYAIQTYYQNKTIETLNKRINDLEEKSEACDNLYAQASVRIDFLQKENTRLKRKSNLTVGAFTVALVGIVVITQLIN